MKLDQLAQIGQRGLPCGTGGCTYYLGWYMFVYIQFSYKYIYLLAYTCIYDLDNCIYARNGFLNFLHVYCTYIYIARICTYLLQYMHVFACMTDYMEIDATCNFAYKNTYKIRTYVQIQQNIRAYTYTIYVQYTVK